MLTLLIQMFACAMSLEKKASNSCCSGVYKAGSPIILMNFQNMLKNLYYIKTLNYNLSLWTGFPNKQKVVNHLKLSVGNDKKVAFVPKFCHLKMLSLSR